MKIRFGLHLDGQRGWRAGNRLAEPVMGPLSLLFLLEAQLGLVRNFPGRVERIVQYRECLKTCDSPSRFYHATFAADDHRHVGDREEPYRFSSVEALIADFLSDVKRERGAR